MRILFHILCLLLIISSCNKKEEDLPKDIMSQEELVDVVVEVEMAQALIKLKFNTTDTVINQKEIFKQVFVKMKTTEQQFNNSLTYYCQQPKVLMEVYEKVIVKLSEKQAENQ